jgi:hypothetical protein
MIIRNSLTGAEFAAELKTEHCAGRPGERVVVVDGKAVEPQGFEIIGCTEREVGNLPRPWATALLNAL